MIFISLCRAHINRGIKYKSKKILIIHLIIKELSQFFFNFASGLRKLCPRHIRNIEALCSLLVNAKPEKLQKSEQENGIMVSAHIAWGCYHTSVRKGFLRACILRRGAYSPTLRIYLTILT